jgi:orotidine-5'-phosphate decarboxylase
MNDNPIFVAIDTADLRKARRLVAAVAPHVGGVKLGLQFFAANGPAGVRKIAEHGLPLFIDLKFHDIPNTVSRAVQSVGMLVPAVLTVHAAGGRSMLMRAKKVAPAGTKVVAVTILTSLSDDDLKRNGIAETAAAQVLRLAKLARGCGLDGIVCSPLEVEAVRAIWPEAYLVVPGIRPAGSVKDDQKRSATPAAARAAGASMLVIGRPITAAADPAAAAAAIAAELAG